MNRVKSRLVSRKNKIPPLAAGTSRSRKSQYLVMAGAAMVFAGNAHFAKAAVYTWTWGGANNNWSTANNWLTTSTLAIAPGGNNLVFQGTTQLSTNNDFPSGSTFSSISFAPTAGAFTLAGDSVSLSAASVPSILSSSTSLETINIPLTLAGDRTISAATGQISIADGIAGISGVDFGTNPGLTAVNAPPSLGTVILNSAGTYTTASAGTASTNVFSGTLQIGVGGSLPSVTVANAANGWVALGVGANATNNQPSAAGTLILGDSTTAINQTINRLVVASGAAAGSAVVGGNSAISTLTLYYLVTTSTDSYGGLLGGSGTNQNNLALVVTGGNTVSLSGVNTYVGGTTIQRGTLVAGNNAAISTGQALTLGDSSNDNGTLDVGGHTITVGSLSVTGAGTGNTIGNSSANAGRLTFAGTGSPSTFGGSIVNTLGAGTGGTSFLISSGTLALTGTNSYALGTTLQGGTLTFSPAALGSGAITLDGGTLQYASGNTVDISGQTINMGINGGTIDTNSNNVTFASPVGAVVATGGFIKAGLGTLTFNAANPYTTKTTVSGGTLLIGSTGSLASTAVAVSAGATMTVNGSISNSTALAVDGTFNSNVPTLPIAALNGGPTGIVNLNGGSALQISGGGTYSGTIADGGSGGSVVVNGGTLTLGGANTYSGGTTVNAGLLEILPTSSTTSALPKGAVTITGGMLQLATNVTAGSQSTPVPASNVNITSLSITGTGQLDINNNHIIINYGAGADPIASIAALINSGYASGAWTGAGIMSTAAQTNGGSYGIGYADSADPGNPAGLASGQIEVMYTLLGDANLDGAVNGSDFAILATNFNKAVSGWDAGDFNYDGAANGSDFASLASNFNKGASQAADLTALDSFATANGLSASVPEPVSIGLMAMGAVGLLARRRRKL